MVNVIQCLTGLKKKATEDVAVRDQETAMAWYRGSKVVEISTTNSSDIALLLRRGHEPLGGKEGKAAEPYLVFRVPRKCISIRSKPKGRK